MTKNVKPKFTCNEPNICKLTKYIMYSNKTHKAISDITQIDKNILHNRPLIWAKQRPNYQNIKRIS